MLVEVLTGQNACVQESAKSDTQVSVHITDSPDSPGPNDADDFRMVRRDHPEQANAGPSDDSADEGQLPRRSKRSSQGQRPSRLLDTDDEEEAPAQPAWQPEPEAAAAATRPTDAVAMDCDMEEDEDQDIVSGHHLLNLEPDMLAIRSLMHPEHRVVGHQQGNLLPAAYKALPVPWSASATKSDS